MGVILPVNKWAKKKGIKIFLFVREWLKMKKIKSNRRNFSPVDEISLLERQLGLRSCDDSSNGSLLSMDSLDYSYCGSTEDYGEETSQTTAVVTNIGRMFRHQDNFFLQQHLNFLSFSTQPTFVQNRRI